MLANRYVTAIYVGLGVFGWLCYLVVAVGVLGLPSSHVDWHVYAAGGLDLMDRTLYREPLYLGGLSLPVDRFNLPPLSAIWALPLLWLPIETGGAIWQALGIVCLTLSMVVLAKIIRAPVPLAAAGLALGPLALQLGVLDGISVGTNNYLMLALVAGFAHQHLARRQRWAGILLGLAIGAKLWPATLLILVVREQRWAELRWAAGFLIVQTVLFLVWLDPSVVPAAADTLMMYVPPATCCGLLGLDAMRDAYVWWPAWLSVMLAALFASAPATGRIGIGLGILASLLLVRNLWAHYLPTVLFAVVLVAAERSPALSTAIRAVTGWVNVQRLALRLVAEPRRTR